MAAKTAPARKPAPAPAKAPPAAGSAPAAIGPTTWQDDCTALAVIYHALERGTKLPVPTVGDLEFLDPILDKLAVAGFIEVDAERAEYRVTKEGVALRNRLVAMFDATMAFKIFANVWITRELATDWGEDDDGNEVGPEADPENPNQVYDNLYDPRFPQRADLPDDVDERGDLGVHDLRTALMTWLSETAADKLPGPIDPHRIVFLQMLAEGELDGEDFWFQLRLGEVWGRVESIVQTAYPWRRLADSEADASAAMQELYTAGMCEVRKREGTECSECGTPLAMYQYHAAKDGAPLDQCPCCEAVFGGPDDPGGDEAEYECPKCQAGVRAGAGQCQGCGATINWGGQPGDVSEEVVEETVTETETVSTMDSVYGYGWYDPYDPFVDCLAFGVLGTSLW